MKTESEQVQRWDDIIFENRNKTYGAYAIRKNYNENVLKAEAISIGIGALIFIIPILMHDEQIIIPVIDPKGDIVLRHYEYDIKPVDPPTRTQPVKKVDASIIPTHITTADVVEPTTQPTETVTYTTGSETGTTEPASSDGPVESGNAIPVDVPTEPFSVVEVMPEYEGGEAALMKFIQRKMRYPSKAQVRGDEGTVFVSFVIGADGKVTDVKVLKGIGKECDEEAVRVISMLDKWKPGIQNKMAVPVRKVLPIKFKLER